MSELLILGLVFVHQELVLRLQPQWQHVREDTVLIWNQAGHESAEAGCHPEFTSQEETSHLSVWPSLLAQWRQQLRCKQV